MSLNTDKLLNTDTYSMDSEVLGQAHGVRLWRPRSPHCAGTLVLHATRMIDLPLTSSHLCTPVVSDDQFMICAKKWTRAGRMGACCRRNISYSM